MERIHYTKPSITELEIGYATDAVSYGWGARCYEYIERFEGLFCDHLGVAHGIATSSCTGALHMGLAALGVGPGDEVILADINWIATLAPIKHLGATPVLVDIDPESWCIDPREAKNAITSKTKAIIATHLYGNLCDMQRLQQIADQHDIALIEDAAEAIGSVYQGRSAGSMGRFGVFSFHGTKTLTTGEGGMFVTDDPKLYEKVLTLSNHGRGRGETRQFWPETVGFKYKMSNVQAAIGCGQMERIEELVGRKREIFQRYQKELSGRINPLVMNVENEGDLNSYWMPTLILPENIKRGSVLAALSDNNIDGRVFFWPLSVVLNNKNHDGNINSYNLYSRGVNLPSYYDMSDSDVSMVSEVILSELL